jgi:hypothetical protein
MLRQPGNVKRSNSASSREHDVGNAIKHSFHNTNLAETRGMSIAVKRRTNATQESLTGGTPVRLYGVDLYADASGYVVICRVDSVQVHLTSGDGAGHEVLVSRAQVVALSEQG